MNKISAYLRLLRFDKPVGILLLWFPTAWALWIANKGNPPIRLVLLFLVGTILMRGAGCVVNDIADRHIDLHVRRTKDRPLTSGELSLFEAFSVLFLFLLASLILLFLLPAQCFPIAIMALIVAGIYPFCKRFFDAPQLILGIAFSMGIPMAYAASYIDFDPGFYLIFFINCIWIVAYDTMYAMSDREDDLKIGVKSTAITFGVYDRLIIGFLMVIMHTLWLMWGISYKSSLLFYSMWFISLLFLLYQYYLIYTRDEILCFKAFKLSPVYGLLMWLAVL